MPDEAARWHDYRASLHARIAELPPGPSRASAVALCARVERLLGRRRESAALVAREIEALPYGLARAEAELRLELAASTIGDGVPEPVVAAARRLPDGSMQARALAMSAFGDLARGARTRRTGRRIAKAAAMLDALPDRELSAQPEALAWLAWSELLIDRPDDAVRHAERGRALGGAYLEPSMLHCLGIAQSLLGEPGRAVATLDEAVERATRSGDRSRALLAQSHQCEVLIWMGEAQAAERLAVQAAERSSVAVGMMAAVRRSRGDDAGCVELLTYAGGGSALPRFLPLRRTGQLVVLSQALTALGRFAEAERAALEAIELGHGLLDGRARLALAGARQSPLLAAELAERFEKRRNLVEAAQARIMAGTLTQNGGREHLIRARALAAQCGARLFEESATRELLRLRAPIDLTARERAVADLVVAGLSNRQIATRLYVSPRTVEATLTRLYAKLGVPSRAALTALLISHP